MMKSKKEQNRMVVGASLSKDLQYLKFPFSLNQNCLKRNKAFSVAEAMMALLIGSVALGAAAPMITKQVKQSNFSDTQFKVLNQKMENTSEEIIQNKTEFKKQVDDALKEIDKRLESVNVIPTGAIMFFELSSCPDGWEKLDNKYNGRYFKVAGSYAICDKSGENDDGSCRVGAVANVVNNAGELSGDAIRNITGEFSAYEMGRSETGINYAIGAFDVKTGTARGTSEHSGKAPLFIFDASRVVPIADENRPRSVSVLACVKK